jgi:hypothetical protein
LRRKQSDLLDEMPLASSILWIFAFVFAVQSLIEAHSFSLASWRRGLTVFHRTVQQAAAPDPSLIGREITAGAASVKLLDQDVCLFRRTFRFLELRTFPLLGEIHFHERSYVVIGRLPYSDVFFGLAFVSAFAASLTEWQGALPPAVQFIAVLLRNASGPFAFMVMYFALSVLAGRDRIDSTYGKVVARLTIEETPPG